MPQKTTTLSLLLTLFLSLPLPALAFWGDVGDPPPALDLNSGYDVNTMATVTGQIVSIQTGEDRPNVQLELNSNGVRMIVCIGPQRYWAENTLPFKPGAEVTVRGSKAQGSDGLIYLFAQKITGVTDDISVVLRDESGRPVWAGNGMRRNQRPRSNNPSPLRQQAPAGMDAGDKK